MKNVLLFTVLILRFAPFAGGAEYFLVPVGSLATEANTNNLVYSAPDQTYVSSNIGTGKPVSLREGTLSTGLNRMMRSTNWNFGVLGLDAIDTSAVLHW